MQPYNYMTAYRACPLFIYFNAMDVADDKEERKYAHSCNGTDESMAPTKEPVSCKITPMTIGVIIPARLPIKLKTPPARPTVLVGAMSPTVLQTIAAMPCPKKQWP